MNGCGQRLREAREAAGLSVADVASKLKMPARVVQSLEQEDWERLGAPVFVRGQLRSYARLLGLAIDPMIEAAGMQPVQPVELTPRTYTPRMRVLGEQLARRAVYIVLTALLVVPVWVSMQSQGRLIDEQAVSLDAPLDQNATPVAAAPAAPLKASMAPVPVRSAAPALSIKAEEDSWIQITGSDGGTVESALLKAGERRDYAAGQVSRVVLGNAAAVVVEHAGQPVDTTPWQRANVARFAVSSDGSPTPVDAPARGGH